MAMQNGQMNNFPMKVSPLPCWHCSRLVALIPGGAVCGRQAMPVVQATPARGCAFAQREVGIDDEPDWVPPVLDSTRAQVLLTRLRSDAAPRARGPRPHQNLTIQMPASTALAKPPKKMGHACRSQNGCNSG